MKPQWGSKGYVRIGKSGLDALGGLWFVISKERLTVTPNTHTIVVVKSLMNGQDECKIPDVDIPPPELHIL